MEIVHAKDRGHILGNGLLGKSLDLGVRILGYKSLDAWFLLGDEFCFPE